MDFLLSYISVDAICSLILSARSVEFVVNWFVVAFTVAHLWEWFR